MSALGRDSQIARCTSVGAALNRLSSADRAAGPHDCLCLTPARAADERIGDISLATRDEAVVIAMPRKESSDHRRGASGRDRYRTEGATTTAPAPRTRPGTNAGVGTGDGVPSRISPISGTWCLPASCKRSVKAVASAGLELALAAEHEQRRLHSRSFPTTRPPRSTEGVVLVVGNVPSAREAAGFPGPRVRRDEWPDQTVRSNPRRAHLDVVTSSVLWRSRGVS